MKFSFGFPKQFSFKNPMQLIRWVAVACMLLYAALLFSSAYKNFYSVLLTPQPVDQSQITAKQEKINRSLLSSIEKADGEKTQKAETPLPGDPFVN